MAKDGLPVRLIILIGVPGSGKSYWAKQFVGESPDRPLIATDAIRARLFGDEIIQGDWSKIWAVVLQQLANAVQLIQGRQAKEAVYDATNTHPQQRREILMAAREAGFTDITGVWMDTAIELCIERNRQRSRQVPEEVIWRMQRNLENNPPHLTEGFNRLLLSSSFVDS